MRGLGGTRVGMGYGVGRLLVPHRGTGPGTCPPLGPIMDLFPIMDISQLWIFLNSGIMDISQFWNYGFIPGSRIMDLFPAVV